MSIETKQVFGVSMNPKMGTRKLTKIWFEEVDEEIRKKYPDLNAKMEECRSVNLSLDIKTNLKEIKQDIEDATIAAINAAAAIAAGILTLPADIAAKIAALADLNLSIEFQASCKKQLHREIDKIVPEHLPDEEN